MLTKEQALENKKQVQKEAEKAWLENEGYGCIELATGCGKTKIAINCIESIRHQFLAAYDSIPEILIVVPTEEMRDTDWPAEFDKWETSMERIKIICYAILNKEDLSKYQMIIYDECHRVTLPNLRKLETIRLNSAGRTYILGLTATLPKVNYPDDMERVHLLRELFPVVYRVTTDEAVNLGLIADFQVFVLKFHLDNKNKNIKAGTKVKPFMNTEAEQYKYLTKKLQIAAMAAQADPRKEGFKFSAISARAQFLYNLPSKLRLAKLCLSKMQGNRILLFAGSIEQANELCGDNVYHSESTREALDKFQRKEINILGAVKALNEGKNLTEPDNGIIVQVDSVDRNLVQRIGRLVRVRYENMAHKATIVILVALGTADENWYNSAIAEFDSKRVHISTVSVPEIKDNGV